MPKIPILTIILILNLTLVFLYRYGISQMASPTILNWEHCISYKSIYTSSFGCVCEKWDTIKATSHTYQEPWPWNCDCPKKLSKGRPNTPPKSCSHRPSSVLWSHMWLSPQPNAILMNSCSCRVLTHDIIE